MNKRLVIIGAGGHGKVVADIAKNNGYEDIVFIDDNKALTACGNYPVIGSIEEAFRYTDRDFVVAIGNAKIRQKVQSMLTERGLQIATLIHPNAVIGEHVTISEGSVVMAGVVVNPYTKIGRGCILNTCSSLDHDCIIGDFVHISVGAHVAGTVTIGDRSWIGIGASVSNNMGIVSDCMIGAGAVVIHDLCESGTYIGVPVKKVNI